MMHHKLLDELMGQMHAIAMSMNASAIDRAAAASAYADLYQARYSRPTPQDATAPQDAKP